jgi:hypothetical protein
MKRLFKYGLFLATVAVLASAISAQALECPSMKAITGDASAQPDLTAQLSGKDVLSQIPGIYGSLKAQFPGVSNAQLSDYLIAAYCPVVKADASLSEEEMKARVNEFADKVVSTVYSR